MATKWESSYTELENINSGYEYQNGDAITTESVNTPIKNADYAVQLAKQAVEAQNYGIYTIFKTYDSRETVMNYTLPSAGIYCIEFEDSVDSYDNQWTFTGIIIVGLGRGNYIQNKFEGGYGKTEPSSAFITVKDLEITSTRSICGIYKIR